MARRADSLTARGNANKHWKKRKNKGGKSVNRKMTLLLLPWFSVSFQIKTTSKWAQPNRTKIERKKDRVRHGEWGLAIGNFVGLLVDALNLCLKGQVQHRTAPAYNKKVILRARSHCKISRYQDIIKGKTMYQTKTIATL